MAIMEKPGNEPIAHVAEDGRVHPLYEHLQGTAALAEKFAAEFGLRSGEDWRGCGREEYDA